MQESELLDIYQSFRKGMEAFFQLPALPRTLKPKRASISARLATSLRPYFPSNVNIDTDLLGTDILVWDENGLILALFWSSSYLAKKIKLSAISFHEREKTPLTLACSLFPGKNHFLVYRIENGFIDYLHVDKNTFSEDVLRRCTIDEGRRNPDQLLLPLKVRRKKVTS